jgi:hypothetical protein
MHFIDEFNPIMRDENERPIQQSNRSHNHDYSLPTAWPQINTTVADYATVHSNMPEQIGNSMLIANSWPCTVTSCHLSAGIAEQLMSTISSP